MTVIKVAHGEDRWPPIRPMLQWVGRKLHLIKLYIFNDCLPSLCPSVLLILFYPLGTLNFRFGKDFRDHLVLIWCMDFRQSSWPLVLYANTSLVGFKPYSLFFLDTGSRSSSQAFHFDDLLGHISLAFTLEHTRICSCPPASQVPDLLANEEQKNIYQCLALGLTSNLSNYIHATFIIRPWPFMPLYICANGS